MGAEINTHTKCDARPETTMEAYATIIDDALTTEEFERWAEALRLASEAHGVTLVALVEVDIREA